MWHERANTFLYSYCIVSTYIKGHDEERLNTLMIMFKLRLKMIVANSVTNKCALNEWLWCGWAKVLGN